MTSLTAVKPRISFIIPVRNDAAHLGRCLNSIQRTAVPSELFEILVADNGSTDGSRDIALEAHARVLDLPNLNVAALRNRAAREAEGDVLAFVDADHEIHPGWPRIVLELLELPGAVAVGAMYETPLDGNWVQRAYDSFRRRGQATEPVNWLPSGNLAVDRAAFEQVGGFDTTLETCEDVDLCRRLRQSGGRILSDPRLASVHRGDPRSLRAIYLGELWRGRDNLRVSLRPPMALRDLPSIVIPLVDLLALISIPLGVLWWQHGGHRIVAAAFALFAGLAVLRAVAMIRRRPGTVGVAEVMQTLIVAGTYDLARALALVGRAGHEARRRA